MYFHFLKLHYAGFDKYKKNNNQDAIYRVCWNSELHTSYNVNLPVFLYVRTLELKKIKNE